MTPVARHESATGVSRDWPQYGDMAVPTAHQRDERRRAGTTAGARGRARPLWLSAAAPPARAGRPSRESQTVHRIYQAAGRVLVCCGAGGADAHTQRRARLPRSRVFRMTKRNLCFTTEPRDGVYRALLQAAEEQASTAYVVVRNKADLSDRARECLSMLKPELLSEEIVRQWPGTRLLTDDARMFTYRLNTFFVRVIERFSDGLYDWIAPDLPEDLGFRRADGSVWLASIAHEHDAWLELESAEVDRLEALCPEITQIVE